MNDNVIAIPDYAAYLGQKKYNYYLNNWSLCIKLVRDVKEAAILLMIIANEKEPEKKIGCPLLNNSGSPFSPVVDFLHKEIAPKAIEIALTEHFNLANDGEEPFIVIAEMSAKLGGRCTEQTVRKLFEILPKTSFNNDYFGYLENSFPR